MAAPWVKIDVGTARHPKLAALGPLAPMGCAHFVAVIAYTQEWATDGQVPRAAARTALAWNRMSVNGSPVTGDIICSAKVSGSDQAAKDALACLAQVNRWPLHQAAGCARRVVALTAERSEHQWRRDLSLLERDFDIKISPALGGPAHGGLLRLLLGAA